MSPPHRAIRRGGALLLVLAALVLVTTASVSLLRLAVTAQAAEVAERESRIADDLLAAAEAPILDWLSTQAADVVLAPDVAVPKIAVLREMWTVNDVECGLQVTAWDQCGMIPLDLARSGSPPGMILPEEIRRTVGSATLRNDQPAGLDFFLDQPGGDGPAVFPVPDDEAPGPVALGALVATHNPGVINVNTAPPHVLEAALRIAGRGGREAILAARAAGTAFSPGGLPMSGRTSDRSLRLAAASAAWSLRIDIHVGMVRRSWWAVYVGSGSAGWECVQRLAIPR